ncbi:MAG: NAD(P)(+) transhydrogenase (Re/Si-specific) subunit alpha, partial [Kiloniellales bacterium]|nr:NAD(P)(+) transhydrogenase (Re/Si-specific) subunit alpha [Kiloniellales bacterium]
MKIAIPKERRAHESRVAASPETVKKLIAMGAEVSIEKGAGEGAALPDKSFEEAGASLAPDLETLLEGAELILKVQRPIAGGKDDELKLYKSGSYLASIVDPFRAGKDLQALADAGVTVFAMDFMPRITRAQSMDVLSSQSNLAGYKAVV